MEVMIAWKKMSQPYDGLTLYPQVLIKVRARDKKESQADDDAQRAVSRVADEICSTDRILVREFGTEPLVRVMVEAETQEKCRRFAESVVDVTK